MRKVNPNEALEIFSILSDTINGANYDDLNDAVYRILIANYHKQREGEWETFPSIGNQYRCSICKEKSKKRHNFCPNCGAKMKGATDEK